MTSRERILTACAHRQPDKLPVDFGGGFPQTEFKAWQLADGTPVLVPKDFNTQYEPNGDLLQWPGNDRSVPPSGRMPAGGHFHDAIMRQPPLDEAKLNPADNMEEVRSEE